MSRYGQKTKPTNLVSTSTIANWFGNQFVAIPFTTVDYLVVAGGGGGGGDVGGGGGAGGYRTDTGFTVNISQNYSVTIDVQVRPDHCEQYTYHSFEEAKSAIESFENTNTVYF